MTGESPGPLPGCSRWESAPQDHADGTTWHGTPFWARRAKQEAWERARFPALFPRYQSANHYRDGDETVLSTVSREVLSLSEECNMDGPSRHSRIFSPSGQGTNRTPLSFVTCVSLNDSLICPNAVVDRNLALLGDC
jgi:hypothetical protein